MTRTAAWAAAAALAVWVLLVSTSAPAQADGDEGLNAPAVCLDKPCDDGACGGEMGAAKPLGREKPGPIVIRLEEADVPRAVVDPAQTRNLNTLPVGGKTFWYEREPDEDQRDQDEEDDEEWDEEEDDNGDWHDEIERIEGYLALNRQAVETMEDPLLAGHIAIQRIKDIAVEHAEKREVNHYLGLLKAIAERAPEAPLRRSALFATAEVLTEADRPAEAAEALAHVLKVGDRPLERRRMGPAPMPGRGGEMMPPGLRREPRRMPAPGRIRRGRGPMMPSDMGPMGPDMRPPRQPAEEFEARDRERDERAERLEARERELDERGRELKRREERLHGWTREVEQRDRALDRRAEELGHLAERIERRMNELREQAEHVERMRRDRDRPGPEERERIERREAEERERMERREGGRRDRDWLWRREREERQRAERRERREREERERREDIERHHEEEDL